MALLIGEPRTGMNLTMVPLSGNPAAALSYILVIDLCIF